MIFVSSFLFISLGNFKKYLEIARVNTESSVNLVSSLKKGKSFDLVLLNSKWEPIISPTSAPNIYINYKAKFTIFIY